MTDSINNLIKIVQERISAAESALKLATYGEHVVAALDGSDALGPLSDGSGLGFSVRPDVKGIATFSGEDAERVATRYAGVQPVRAWDYYRRLISGLKCVAAMLEGQLPVKGEKD